jgi:hypothetical protein
MVTGSTPTSAAGVLAVLLGDGDFDEVAEIIGAWAAARPSLRLPPPGGRRTSHPAPRSTARRRQPASRSGCVS